MSKIILRVPEKTGRGAAVKPKIAQAWIAALPTADPIAIARQLHQTLYALNRQDIDAQDRFELCELYASPIAAVTEAFQPQFLRLALPFSPTKKRLAEFLIQLQAEMAYAYKHVIIDVLVRGARLKTGQLTIAIERAIGRLGDVLLRSYQFYAPPPPGVWRELHALYEFAERSHTENESIPPLRDDEAQTSIAHHYKRILLLGLSGPYQLPPNECRNIYGFLEVWADKATLSQDLEVTNPVGHFLIDLTADAPPRLMANIATRRAAASLRVLNATNLAATVHGFIARLQRGESPKLLELGTECIGGACLDMFRRMIKAWGFSARRQSHRVQRNDSIPVCIGLNAIHFFSSGQQAFSPHAEYADISHEDVLNIDLETLDRESPAPSNAPIQQVFRVDEWRMQDESANGLALSRNGSTHGHVRVGDLVGIEGDDGRWRAAAVRWLKTGEADELEMGLEILGLTVVPVVIRTDEANYSRRALLIPEMPLLRRSASLIVAAGSDVSGVIELMQDDETRAVKSREVIERTSAYVQVGIVDINRPNSERAAPA